MEDYDIPHSTFRMQHRNWRIAYLGSTEFGGLDFAGDVTLDSWPEFTEDPDRESGAGVGWL